MKYEFKSYFLDYPLVRGRVFDVFEPEEYTKDTAIFWVHGGGWHSGGRDFYEIEQALCDRGYIVASTTYRLDVNGFEQIKDIREAYDRFVTILKKLGRPLNIAVYGVSAGAHLASLMCCAAPGECGEECTLENQWVKPCKVLLQATPHNFYHWEGMQPSMWNTMQSVAGVPFDKDPEPYRRLSLSTYINETNPPIFFMEAELEGLFPSEHNLKTAKQHREWGIKSHYKVYEKVEHGFLHNLLRKAQREALEDFCLFLEDKLETL